MKNHHKQTLEYLQKLNLLQEVLLGPENLEKKLQRITSSVVEIFNADFSRIWVSKQGDRCDSGCIHAKVHEGVKLCSSREYCLHLIASSGRYTHIDGPHSRMPFGLDKIGRIASGEISKFLTNNVINDPQIMYPEWAREIGLVSFAGHRLQDTSAKPIGVLALFSKNPIYEEENTLIEGLAGSTAQLIQSSKVEEIRKETEKEREKLIKELQNALTEVKTLSGLLPICAHCKKIRDDKGYWKQIESYISAHSEVEFSHSICPECVKKLYPKLS